MKEISNTKTSLYIGSTIGIIGSAIILVLIFTAGSIASQRGPLPFIVLVSLILMVVNLLINIITTVSLLIDFFKKVNNDK